MDNPDIEDSDKFNTFGIYKMVQDIHDEEYTSPLTTIRDAKPASKQKRQSEVHDILWWVSFVISMAFSFFYLIAVYFTYFENPKEFETTFSN